tara:strand:+ start:128 stop:505 length:378 start_codon:yes stop_codon:yes gene_type:complete
MAIWNIFLWLLVGILAFIIGLSSVERKLTPSPIPNLHKGTENLFENLVKKSSEPILEVDEEEYISDIALPNELEEEIIKTEKLPKAPKSITILCPECNEEMKVPKSDGLQNVKCKKCGLSGEFEL